jgi:hypothetical protein
MMVGEAPSHLTIQAPAIAKWHHQSLSVLCHLCNSVQLEPGLQQDTCNGGLGFISSAAHMVVHSELALAASALRIPLGYGKQFHW